MLILRVLSEGGEGPNTELAWLLISVLAIFLLVIAAGWWSSSKKQPSIESGHNTEHSTNVEVDDTKTVDGNSKAAKSAKKSGRKAK